jgi:invasion protein IalB
MPCRVLRLICLVLLPLIGGAVPVAAQDGSAPDYGVKPSEVAIPPGEKLGEYRRVIQPFKNWTLICDESLTSKRRVCNITQSIVNPEGAVVFNWSLIATAEGKPLMMMRIPAAAGVERPIALTLGKKPDRIVAQTNRCDAYFCYATIAIGNVLKRHIQAGTDCDVAYEIPQVGAIAFKAPLGGLAGALAGLK